MLLVHLELLLGAQEEAVTTLLRATGRLGHFERSGGAEVIHRNNNFLFFRCSSFNITG